MKERRVVVRKKDIENIRKNKYRCQRCGAVFGDSKNKLDKHLEEQHSVYSLEKHLEHNNGDATVKNQGFEPTKKVKKNKPIEQKFVSSPVYKKPPHKNEYDNPNECYLVEDEIHCIQPYSDGTYDIICKNCLKTTHTTRKPNPEQDLLLCGFCGMNLFRDNRKRIYEWLQVKPEKNKLPNSIRMDVVMSAIPTGDNKFDLNRDKL